MHLRTNDIPIAIDAPGAIARQERDFGDADGTIGAEHMVLKGGTDLAPLLLGLDDDACSSPHWGYVVAGDVVVSYLDGTTERCTAGDVVHWPAGHRLRVVRDAELVLFSPQDAHTPVLDHIRERAPAAPSASVAAGGGIRERSPRH